jgi:hypothetical protein
MKRIIICFFLFLSFQSHAQPYIDIISFRNYLMPFSVDDSSEGKLNMWFTGSADIPLKHKEDIFLFSPFIEFYGLDTNIQLTGYALPVSFIKQWKSSKWKTAFTVIPRMNYSEFSWANSFQTGVAMLAIYKKSETLKYKFGAYYNSEFFGFFMLPLLGLDWNVNEKLNVFGVLPGSMNVEYKMWKRVYTGLAYRSITSSFRAYYDDDYYKIQDNHIRVFFDFYLTKNLVLTAEAGHSVFRSYSYGIRNDDAKAETDLKYKDGPVIKVAASWRIRLDEKYAE